MIGAQIESASAWTAATLPPGAGRLRLEPGCVDELLAAAEMLRADPLPVLALDPADFPLGRCRGAAARIKAMLDDGPGFALVDGLPLDRLRPEDAVAVFWLLASLIARPVAQKWDGAMVYDVRDLGRPPGNGVRPSGRASATGPRRSASATWCGSGCATTAAAPITARRRCLPLPAPRGTHRPP